MTAPRPGAWTAVDDALPPEGEETAFLVYCDGGEMAVSYLVVVAYLALGAEWRGVETEVDLGELGMGEVTHWMPLPAPPWAGEPPAPRPPGGGELPAALREATDSKASELWRELSREAGSGGISTQRAVQLTCDIIERRVRAAWPAVEREVLERGIALAEGEAGRWADIALAAAQGAAQSTPAEALERLQEALRLAGRLSAPAPAPAEVEAAVTEALPCVTPPGNSTAKGECRNDHRVYCPARHRPAVLAALARIRWADTLVAGRLRAAAEKVVKYTEQEAEMSRDIRDRIDALPGGVFTAPESQRLQRIHAVGWLEAFEEVRDLLLPALFAPPPDGWAELAELVAAVRTSAAYAKAAAGNTTGDERVKHLAIADYGEAILRDLLAALPGLGEGRG